MHLMLLITLLPTAESAAAARLGKTWVFSGTPGKTQRNFPRLADWRTCLTGTTWQSACQKTWVGLLSVRMPGFTLSSVPNRTACSLPSQPWSQTNFAVGPDSFTPANCNEAQCEQGNPGHFAKLSGASRRKMNIHSDISRPKDQQCSIIGAVPKDADGFNDWGPFFEELCPREASPP